MKDKIKNNDFNRNEKEMAIQVFWLEKILGHKLTFLEAENNERLLKLINVNGAKFRQWLDSLSDREVDQQFKKVPKNIRKSIGRKELDQLMIYGAA